MDSQSWLNSQLGDRWREHADSVPTVNLLHASGGTLSCRHGDFRSCFDQHALVVVVPYVLPHLFLHHQDIWTKFTDNPILDLQLAHNFEFLTLVSYFCIITSRRSFTEGSNNPCDTIENWLTVSLAVTPASFATCLNLSQNIFGP